MNEFQPVGLQHKALFRELFSYEGSESSSVSFGNIFLWDVICRRNIARLEDRLGVEYLCPRGIFYAYPLGRGDLGKALDALSRRAAEHKVRLQLRWVTAAQRSVLESAVPGRFDFTEDRDNFDYIYPLEAMATLSGKKLHGKRNFCNRFEAANNWHFAPLEPERFDHCRAIMRLWDAERDGGNPEEGRAVERAFAHWDALDLLGGVLYVQEEPVAFTVGEPISPDVIDVHFEKARNDVPGAYPMIAREFARYLRTLRPATVWLNREEDMGLPNLRRAKEEWYPDRLLEKYTALERSAL